jgi:hypothetical protein
MNEKYELEQIPSRVCPTVPPSRACSWEIGTSKRLTQHLHATLPYDMSQVSFLLYLPPSSFPSPTSLTCLLNFFPSPQLPCLLLCSLTSHFTMRHSAYIIHACMQEQPYLLPICRVCRLNAHSRRCAFDQIKPGEGKCYVAKRLGGGFGWVLEGLPGAVAEEFNCRGAGWSGEKV